jgi:hypothetical protein
MKHALVIKTDMMLKPDILARYQKKFAEQLKTGVVIIPPYFNAELLNVPTDVEVIVEAAPEAEFLNKKFHIKKDAN